MGKVNSISAMPHTLGKQSPAPGLCLVLTVALSETQLYLGLGTIVVYRLDCFYPQSLGLTEMDSLIDQ